MDFTPNQDQALLIETLDKVLAAHEPRAGYDPALWAGIAALSLPALPFAEEDGGFGGTATDAGLVMERIGRHAARLPFLEATILAGTLIARLPASPARTSTLEGLSSGARLCILADAEPGRRWQLGTVATRALRGTSGFQLDGLKAPVPYGQQAAAFLVSARAMDIEAGDGQFFLVPAEAPGLTCTPLATPDGTPAATITLDGVLVPPEAHLSALCPPGKANRTLSEAIDAAVAAQASEAVGLMAGALDLTVEHIKTRKQFGTALGSFQAVQHRAADMLVQLELARSAAFLAMQALEQDEAQERRTALASAHIQICRAARFIAQNAIQLHGGIGLTQEYRLGAFVTRLSALEWRFGDAEHHLDLLAAASVPA